SSSQQQQSTRRQRDRQGYVPSRPHVHCMSHGGVSLSDVKDGGVLNLSGTSTPGGDNASISVAFDYTAESLACHDSPSGTCGFLYTVPSPSPTAPSCSVRLSADSGGRASGSCNNNGSLACAARSPTVVGKGRRLQWDGGGGGSTSSTSGGSTSSTPVRRRPEPAVGGQAFPS
ncbi:unnamed protein product, partial [Ectocarpus fasciculatus]